VFVTGDGEARVINSTISGNVSDGLGGGIAASNMVGPATVTVNSSTITNNSADQGGGIGNSGSMVRMRNTIVAGNSADTAGPDILGVVNSQGHNLIQSMAGAGITGVIAGNILEQDPQLGPLAGNGGPTLTHALLPGSPAVDVGDAAQFRPIDQRGVERPQGAAPDIGAFEGTEHELAPIIEVTSFEDGGPGSLRQAVLDANATPGRHRIVLPAGVYQLTIAGADEDGGLTGDLDITDHLIIAGAGAGETIIDGGGLDRIFDIGPVADVSISGVTLRNGRVTLLDVPDEELDEADFDDASGGAIRNYGVLTLEGVVINGNHADAKGGGVFGGWRLGEAVTMIWNSIISNNSTGADWGSGGGIAHSSERELVIISNTIERNSAPSGGGIDAGDGTVTIHASRIVDNQASGWGGGIAFDGESFAIFDSTISGNVVGGIDGEFGWGGGIFLWGGSGSTYTIERTLISGNAAVHGGGLASEHLGMLQIVDSTFSRNHAQLTGGAIRLSQINTDIQDGEDDDPFGGSGTARLQNVTVANNTAGNHGGGIYYTAVAGMGQLDLVNVTIARNVAGITGGGVHSHNSEQPLTAGNSIFAGNRDGGGAPDFLGTLDGLGHNLIQNDAWTNIIGNTTGNILGQDPRLAPLGEHGGPTPTMPLLPDSPAVDAGNDELAPDADQRGITRPQGEASDIGAFERQEGDLVIPRIIVTSGALRRGSQVRVFDADTGQMLHSFMPYGGRFRNPVTLAVADMNGDGMPNIITAPNWGRAPVRVFDGLTGRPLDEPVGRIVPFSPRFDGGVFVATADLNHDGVPEIIASQLSGGTRVRVFDGRTGQQLPRPIGDFPAFWHGFNEGVTLAVGDVDGDGTPDIITGMRVGGSSVRVFSGRTGAIIREFDVHPLRDGIRLASGDLSGNGVHEILTVQRPGILRIFDSAARPTGPSVPPQPPAWPSAFDVNRDGQEDILLGVVEANRASVRVFSGSNGEEIRTITAFDGPLRSAMFVAAG
jgi:predicted outer membrane repeat protein